MPNTLVMVGRLQRRRHAGRPGRAAGAGMLLAELIPGEVQGLVETVIADTGQALGLGRRAVVGNEAEGLPPASPGPQIEVVT